MTVSGEVDLTSELELRSQIDAALAERPIAMVIDLSLVSFLASCGLTALLQAKQQAHEQETRIAIVANDRRVVRPLEATGVDQLLSVYSSRADALRDIAPGDTN
ncbi:STAS domain-containing protein [Tamaricihabitans halophyticus]|uniref:STAS domain-containing protein n=1 Tax=Tamaricihabitans halophyticus TaxID=1262583 RepID=UPI0014047839|nr:STAS domain-containing protein [Tamaricihabitans halophyticus]